MKDRNFTQKFLGIGLPLILFLSLFGMLFYILVYQNEDMVRLSSVHVVILLMTITWLAGKFWKGEAGFARSALNLPVLAFLAAGLVSIIRATNPYQGFGELFRIGIYASLYFLIVNNLREEKYVNRFLYALLILSTVIAAHSIFQYLKLDFLWFMFPPGASFARASSVFGNADFLGGYLAMAFPIAFSLFLFRKGKLFFGISSVLIFFSLLLTFTRSAWVSWAMSLLFLVLLLAVFRRDVIAKNLKWLLVGMGIFIALAVILNFIKGGAILSRVSAIFNWGEYSVRVRFGLWRRALDVFKHSPVIGVGLDNFKIVPQGQGCRVHNEYLQILAETGILGIAVFAWFLFAYFREGFRVLKSTTSYRQILVIAFMSSVFAMLVDSLFCFPLHRVSHNVLFWSVLGMTISLGDMGKVDIAPESGKMRIWRFPLSIGVVAIGAFFIYLVGRSFMGVYYYQKGFEMNRYAAQGPEIREKTRQTFEKASKFAPYHYQIQHDWAIVAIQSGDLEKGEKAMQWSERLYPDKLPDVRLELGLLYYQKGEYRKAEEVWRETTERFPSSARAYFYLGGMYNNQGKLEGAVEYSRRATELDPNNPDYFNALAKIYFRKGKHSAAKKVVEKGLSLAPDDPELQNMMKVFQKRGQATF